MFRILTPVIWAVGGVCTLPFLLILSSFSFTVSTAAQADAEGIKPQDVFVRVAFVRDELELIRLEMGKPKNRQVQIEVTNAAPREVFFQALTLFHKANRLCFERTRERAPELEIPVGEIQTAHVFVVVDAALRRVQSVKAKLGIAEKSAERSRNESKTPNDVFRSIVQANRQVNLLLDQQFSPSDVFQQVTLAVGYTSELLALFRGATTIPDTPLYERSKRPADVYGRLVGCFRRVRGIADRSGLKTLELKVSSERLEDVGPSDVYDIASLLVSELAYLHAQREGARPPDKAYYPGFKLPSHVYQRAGILERQLIELETRISENSTW